MGQLCSCCFKKNEQQEQQANVVTNQTTSQQLLAEPQTETITMRLQKSTLNEEFHKISINDFRLMKTLGRGSFGKVLLVRKKSNQKLYAMKILPKGDLARKKQQEYAKTERYILERINHPFIVRLYYAFQSQHKLYYVIDFCIGGELFFHLRRAYKFKEEFVIFYAAEIIVALEYLHEQTIIYRDLKPENVLLCNDGHIKLIDFGLSKISQRDRMAFSIVGTPEYLAPEIYSEGTMGHDEQCDWWSLGALMYEMMTGAAPFYSQDKTLMFRNRLEKPLDIKPWFSENCASLLIGLLNNDPKNRLTLQQIKSHAFFERIVWEDVLQKKLQPPIVPELKGELDLKYFNKVMFVEEPAADSPGLKSEQFEEYDKFTFEGDI